MTRWTDSIGVGGSDWRMGHVSPAPLWQSGDLADVHNWLPATVPGNVEGDLFDAGAIADPVRSPQDASRLWTESVDWWYRRHFSVPLSPDMRAHLILHGVDYYSSVHVNGHHLGCHEGMFSRQVFDISRHATTSEDVDLAIRLWGAHALPQRDLSWWQRLAEPALQPRGPRNRHVPGPPALTQVPDELRLGLRSPLANDRHMG